MRPAVVPSGPAQQRPQGSRADREDGSVKVVPGRWRRLHLGLDFGTCWSKLVLRDYEAPEDRCLVVFPAAAEGGNGDFKIPSLVVLRDGRLHFGHQAADLTGDQAAQVFHSLKIRAALPEAFHGHASALPTGFTVEDLVTLALLYILQLAEPAARQYAARFGAAPRISMTTGAPIDHLSQAALQERFVRMARSAYDAFRSPGSPSVQGLRLEDARQLLLETRQRLSEKGPVTSPRDWVRSEAEAALLWAFFSPAVGPGLYASVDIGAGSTDATFFKITRQYEGGTWRKAGMAFYGAVARPPGMDAIGDVISRHAAVTLPSVRGREEELVGRLPAHALNDLGTSEEQISETYLEAFRRGYPLDKRTSAWSDYGLFLIGGGSKFARLRRRLHEMSVWPGQLPPGKTLDPGHPADLRGPEGESFRGDPTFLLVAYGLSHLAAEVPPVTNPDDIPPLVIRLPRRIIDRDELYPK